MKYVQAILYANPDYYPPIINGIRCMDNANLRVDLLSHMFGKQWGITYPPAVTIRRIPSQGGSWRAYSAFVRTVLRTADPNANVFMGHDMHGLLPARLLASRFRRPLIYHCHDFANDAKHLALGGRIVHWFERCFAHTSDLVIVPDADRSIIVAKELKLRRPPLIVANAPLTSPQADGGTLLNALRERGFSYDKVLFRQGFVGNGHALETTLRSMLHWDSARWGFVVMGSSEPEYLVQLQQLAKELGIPDRFVYLPPVSYDNVSHFTTGADAGHALYEPVNINHQFAGTASNKILEYMAAGLPIITSDQPDMCRIIETHRCGISAKVASPMSIANAVNKIFGNDSMASQLGRSGRHAFETVFNYRQQYAPVIEWINQHVDKPVR